MTPPIRMVSVVYQGEERQDTIGRPVQNLRHGEANGRSRTKEYRVWAHIKDRCYRPTDKSYHNYGGRGIGMNEAWRNSYEAFLNGVGRAPSPQHSLDRIDNDKGYEPGNVRWTTQKQQLRNTRRNVLIDGVPLIDVCRARGLSYQAVQVRLRRGDPQEIALSPLKGADYRKLRSSRTGDQS